MVCFSNLLCKVKNKRFMKYFKQALLLALLCVMSLQANAQTNKVGVNTTTPTEILDVNGTMRVRDLPDERGLKYNGGTNKNYGFSPQYMVVADAGGVLGRENMPMKPLKWFYMPPMNLPIDPADPSFSAGVFTVNLYDEYRRQFTTAQSISTTALKTFAANELDYYVLYYDVQVFQNVSISDAGVLKYAVKPNAVVTPEAFFTIVYRVR